MMFKVGDRVERIGSLVPPYMKNGIVTDVKPHPEGIEWATEYEVDFEFMIGKFYESQLRLVTDSSTSKPTSK
jgi:hypothetical protein